MKLNVLNLIWHSGPIVKFVLVLLAGMSVVSWAIIFLKVRLLKRAQQNSREFVEYFWNQRNMEAAYRKATEMSFSPIAVLFLGAFKEITRGGGKEKRDSKTERSDRDHGKRGRLPSAKHGHSTNDIGKTRALSCNHRKFGTVYWSFRNRLGNHECVYGNRKIRRNEFGDCGTGYLRGIDRHGGRALCGDSGRNRV